MFCAVRQVGEGFRMNELRPDFAYFLRSKTSMRWKLLIHEFGPGGILPPRGVTNVNVSLDNTFKTKFCLIQRFTDDFLRGVGLLIDFVRVKDAAVGCGSDEGFDLMLCHTSFQSIKDQSQAETNHKVHETREDPYLEETLLRDGDFHGHEREFLYRD